jgi:flagellum-specific peptidoglycan hydrolase FlgJ
VGSPFTLPSSLIDEARRQREKSALDEITSSIDTSFKQGMSALESVAKGAAEQVSPLMQALQSGGLTVPSLESLGPTTDAAMQQRDQYERRQQASRVSQTTPPSGIAPARPTDIPGPDLSPESGTPVRSAAEMNADMPPTAGEPGGPPLANGPVWEPSKGPAPGGEISNASKADFVRTAYPYMLNAAGGDRNLADLMLAKAISENGSIGSGRPFWANNFSGIKWNGEGKFVEADTWEDYGNGPVAEKAKFRVFDTPQEGIAGFMQFLHDNSRYHKALAQYQQDGDAEGLFRGILKAGYATDKAWVEKLKGIRDTQVAPVTRTLNAGSPAPAIPPQAPAGAPPAGASIPRAPDMQTLPDTPETRSGTALEPVPMAPNESPLTGPNDPRIQRVSQIGQAATGDPLSMKTADGVPMPIAPDPTSEGRVRGYSQEDIRYPGSMPYDVTDDEGIDRTNDPLYPVPLPAQRLPGLSDDAMYRQPLDAAPDDGGYVDPDQGPREALPGSMGAQSLQNNNSAPNVSPESTVLPTYGAGAGDDPGTQTVGAVNGPPAPAASPYDDDQSFRPTPRLGQTPVDPPIATDVYGGPPRYDPRDADQGPHESPRYTPPETWYGRAAETALQVITPALEAYDAANEWLINNPITGSLNPQAMGRELGGTDQLYVETREDQLRLEALIRRYRAGDASVEPEIRALTESLNRRTKVDRASLLAAGQRNPDKGAETLGQAVQAGATLAIAPGLGSGVARNVVAGALDPIGQGLGAALEVPGRIAEAAPAVARRGSELLEQGRATARRAEALDTGGGMTFGSLGPVPQPEPVRIPRAGYADDLSEGAESLVRNASERNAPQEVVRRVEVAERAQRLLGFEPEQVRAWQDQAITEAPDTRAVRGEALRSAEYADAERVDVAMTRLEAAMTRVRDVENGLEMAPADRLETADALLEAAQAAAAFGRSAAASTAEGRATARALGQRRNAILARQAYETSQRARQVGTDARFAAQAVMQAANRGQITPEGIQRLRTLRDKLLEAERNGLAGDGTGGRLVAMEQPSTRASSTVGPVAGRRGPGVLARAATDVGNVAFGSIVGGTTGYMAPADTEEERLRNAQIGVGLGAVGYPLVGRAMRRGRGALATFGPAPSPGAPNRAIAVGSDPSRRYEFRYRVADLRDLVPSNLPNGAPNPAFPRELQPRSRERVASQLQIDQIAQGLEPDALLNDVGRLDSGPMIVGSDNIVESGNGRTLALQRAAAQYPEQYQRYVESLKGQLGQYGLADDALEGVQLPVLVRERVSDVDRAAFAAEANNSGILRMSSVEQAAQDAGNLSDDVVANLAVAENDTIASALRKTENRDLVRQWVGSLPENERASVLDADGNLSAQGYERLTNAMLMRTYGSGAGERLARVFIESADPTVRNVQTALMASLPDMARAEALIRAGQRSAELSIAEDVATAVDMLARLKRDGIPVREYLGQSAMFERELTPMQEDMLRFLDQYQRRPATIRESLREYASRVENSADPNQGDMFGGEVASASKEEVWRGSTATIEREAAAAAEARAAARRARANDSGLAAADPESLAPVEDIIPGTGGPEGRLAQEGAPVIAPRPGPVDPTIAPSGGPQGAFTQEGAPVQYARPGPVGDVLPSTGGPRGELEVQGGPVRYAQPTPVENIAPATGGPEGRLAREGAPPELANLPRVDPNAIPGGGPESTLTLASGRTIKDVVGQIDEVLANPNAPGAVERLRALHDDLQEISTQGFRRSSDIRRRLQRNGLLRAGLAARSDDVEPLVRALANVDPDRPEEMQAVLRIISKPRLIDRLLEYQYVNMLSSPITQAINISSNTMQIAGRLLLQNPLEFAFSGGRSTGVGAAFQGAARGFREGLGEAGQIMRTGTSAEQINRATEIGDYSHVNREALTEKFGKAGALLHVISTRPLAAMDALLGHVAYAGAAEQYAQRTADQLLRNKAPEVAGMSREAARRHVMANIWDYPSIVERAGKIEDYTLLRSKDTQGNNWGRVERALRQAASLRNPSEDAGFAGQATAFLANQVLPFFNVPLNFAKQGAERTAGVPVNAVRAIRAYGRGDVERGAELAAKATIGAGALATGIVLAAGDNLTDDGPEDAGQRAIWELTHKRNSYRVPGTDQWISWEGTPFAIPFGMIAGARRGWTEANERAAKKGETDLVDVVGSAALKTAQGGAEGFFSQSFIRGLADQYKLLTGQDTGLSTVAAQGANTVSRFIPASGMVNFFARVADDVERDAGKPQATSDLPENIGARVASRLPGVGIPGTDIGIRGPRSYVDPKLSPYGEPVPNEQGGVYGAIPYYRGEGSMAGDPITRRLEVAHIGAPPPATEITFRGMTIPLNMRDQRVFRQAWGQAFRRELEGMQKNGKEYPPEAYEKARSLARDEAEGIILEQLGSAEIRRRVEGRQAVGAR